MAAATASTYSAIVYSEPPTLKTSVVQLPVPEPAAGEVLVRLRFSGVCHTDYGLCTNAFQVPYPTQPGQVGGHEGVGEVVALGPGVVAPAVGAKVGIKFAADACLNCDTCLEGGETSCANVKISGYYHPGTFQQYCLTSAKYTTVIPDNLDLASAAPLMCGGVTVYAALKRAKAKFGSWVLVAGAGGGLGHLAIQYAKALGTKVIAIDTGAKEALCKTVGADVFVDFTQFADDASLTARILEATGGLGAKTVLACSSSQRAYDQAVNWLAFRGTLVCLGMPESGLVPIAGAIVEPMVHKELTIFAMKTGNRAEAKEALDIAAAGLIKTHFELKPMTSLTEIFTEMHSGLIQGRAVIDLR